MVSGIFCARDWIRTSTPFPAPPPQGGLSTSFNTRAAGCKYLCYIHIFQTEILAGDYHPEGGAFARRRLLHKKLAFVVLFYDSFAKRKP
jgi:hypothetical protein